MPQKQEVLPMCPVQVLPMSIVYTPCQRGEFRPLGKSASVRFTLDHILLPRHSPRHLQLIQKIEESSCMLMRGLWWMVYPDTYPEQVAQWPE